jgi:ethanolamine ammonia-lyase small subunit
MTKQLIQTDPSAQLRSLTNARIGLGNVGGALPTNEILSFRLAHAEAKDAVYHALDIDTLQAQIEEIGVSIFVANSRANSRDEYLKRPDLGRRLSQKSIDDLVAKKQHYEIVLVVADGLSAEAVNKHSVPILRQFISLLSGKYSVAVVLVKQGRVAIADEIAEIFGAKLTAIFIGERPGLSSPQSMGIYLTYAPKVGLTDESRNCISNIHTEGLSYDTATQILYFYMSQAMRIQKTGIDLKLDLGLLEG